MFDVFITLLVFAGAAGLLWIVLGDLHERR